MNRREALSTLVAALVPTWNFRELPRIARPVPLHEFCEPFATSIRFDMTTPFIQSDRDDRLFTYATDCKICIRVDAREEHRGTEQAKRPPVESLAWQYEKLGGWRPWPKQNHILADNSPCPKCHGYGTADGKIGSECEPCGGNGRVYTSWDGDSKKCPDCHGHGITGPICTACKGKAYGVFPGIQEVGSELIAAEYDRKIRTHLRDVEYTTHVTPFVKGQQAIAFRFDGGVGLLMPLKTDMARNSIRAANS